MRLTFYDPGKWEMKVFKDWKRSGEQIEVSRIILYFQFRNKLFNFMNVLLLP